MFVVELKLKELLEQKKMTQKELSQKSKIREGTISDIVRGTRTVINFEHLAKIAEVLKVTDIRDLIELKRVEE